MMGIIIAPKYILNFLPSYSPPTRLLDENDLLFRPAHIPDAKKSSLFAA
jgi:hypothetical protein